MTVTREQVRKLMEELAKHNKLGRAAMMAGMSPKTARSYRESGEGPKLRKRRGRTRQDPFESDWEEIVEMLSKTPELNARTVFDFLNERAVKEGGEEKYTEGQLRTLQRRVKRWRGQRGPGKEVFFAQNHRPGEALQTDFTRMRKLKITIEGEELEHLLANTCLPYSNWQSVKVVRSESMLALRTSIQKAVFSLGRVPKYHQTDNSSAATQRLEGEELGKRGFNKKYQAFVERLGMQARRTGVGQKEQNGDVEASNGVLKRRIEQYLLLRGSRDFPSVEAYQAWLDELVRRANKLREERLAEELTQMRALVVSRLDEFDVEECVVSKGSTIRLKHNAYSVPSRLIGERVRVHLYEDKLEIFFGGERQLVVERLLGRFGSQINYRHLIDSLIRKPGAFARYRHRQALFPTMTFRRAYDSLCDYWATQWHADLSYLRLLYLAAQTMESEVEAAVELLLQAKEVPLFDRVLSLLDSQKEPHLPPPLAEQTIDLGEYDALLEPLI